MTLPLAKAPGFATARGVSLNKLLIAWAATGWSLDWTMVMVPTGLLEVAKGSDLLASQAGLNYFLIVSGVFTSSMIVRISSNFLIASLAVFSQNSYPKPRWLAWP
jgi:hypothetical protein